MKNKGELIFGIYFIVLAAIGFTLNLFIDKPSPIVTLMLGYVLMQGIIAIGKFVRANKIKTKEVEMPNRPKNYQEYSGGIIRKIR